VGLRKLSHELWQKKLIAEAKLRDELLKEDYRRLTFTEYWP